MLALTDFSTNPKVSTDEFWEPRSGNPLAQTGTQATRKRSCLVKTARTRGRSLARTLAALTLATSLVPTTVLAQKAGAPGKAVTKPSPAAKVDQAKQPTSRIVAIPVNPNDPVAIINNEVITRAQLADEAIARNGPEILKTLMARRLLEQAVRGAKLEVTPDEINREIDGVAMQMAGLSREAWLITLNKERNISPEQYARDIIFPAIALRKLAASRAQVTDKDIKAAFDASYGEKIRVRVIMTDKLRSAQLIWEELKKNPNGFEAIARERSTDQASRSLGGLVGEPITRHAYPLNVSEKAFLELVDGDPGDKDPSHKPKDGDYTGPIQVTETTYMIIRREGLIEAQKQSLDNPVIKKQMHDLIYQVKLKDAMESYYNDLIKAASIENRLAGTTKLANEELNEDFKADGDRKLMSDPNSAIPESKVSSSARAAAAGAVRSIPDADVKRVESLKGAPEAGKKN